jgi:hypothetical protein
MTNIIGWLISVGVVWFICSISLPNIKILFDAPTFVFIFSFTYGLTIAVYGLSKTVNSIVGFKFLVIEKPDRDPELSNIYKTQISGSVIAGIIMILIGVLSLLNNVPENEALFPALAVLILGLMYPALISGLVYYPLYKKLA